MGAFSEDAVLTIIDRYFDNRHSAFLLGRHDDCAIFKAGRELVCSSDFFLEDIHFRRSYFAAGDIGYKALAVNISDLAACASSPIGFSLCLGLPRQTDMYWLEDFFAGMSGLAKTYNMLLCGGDLSSSEKLQICVSAFGEKPANGRLLKRCAARAGDSIFVAGDIGLARIGLREMEESGAEICRQKWPIAAGAHLRPVPQVRAALLLGEYAASNDVALGLMDVSDGVARDLPRLLGGDLGAHLDFTENALHSEVVSYAKKHGENSLLAALAGGEDYALLGTCPPQVLGELQNLIPGLWKLGYVAETGGIECFGKAVTPGFDHFANNKC